MMRSAHGQRLLGGSPAQAARFAGAVALVLLAPSAAPAQDEAGPQQAALRDFNATAALQNSGFYARAGEKWTEFIREYPEDERLPQANYYLGVCQLRTKKYREAIETFQTVLSKFPQFDQADGAQLNMGMAQFEIASESDKPEDHAAAAKALAVVAEKYPKSDHAAKALYFRGESHYAAGDSEAAVEAYQKLVDSYHDSRLLPEAYYALGTTLQELAQYDGAVDAYQAFLANADFAEHELAPEVRLRLAMTFSEQGKTDEAEPLFGEVAALTEFPYADFALLRQGECLLESGQAEKAVEALGELPKRFPESRYGPPAQLASGKGYYRMEKLDEAVEAFSPVASSDLEEIAGEASYWLGRTLLEQDKPDDAFQHLEQAAKKHADGPFAPYIELTRINSLYQLPDRRTEAAPLYAEFAKRFPDHSLGPQALYMSAVAALEEQDYATARTQAEAFLSDGELAEHPLLPDAIYVAAESRLMASQQEDDGDFDGAERLYRRLVEADPEHERAPRSHLRIGWCLSESEKHAEAFEYLKGKLSQLELADHKAEAQLMMGRCRSAEGEHQQALQAFDAALQASPEWDRADEVLFAAARCSRALDDLPKATERLTKLLNEHRESDYRAHATFELGEIAQEQERLDEAIKHFRTVTDEFAESEVAAAAYYGLASALFAKEEYADAVAPLTGLLDDFGDSDVAARGRYLRGLAHQRAEQFQPAADDLQAFLKGNADDELRDDARYALALSQAGLERFDQAAATLRGLLEESPDYANADKAQYELGHALVALEKPAEAAESFRTLGEKWPESPLASEGWFRAGQFHEESAGAAEAEQEKQKQWSEAARAYATGAERDGPPELQEKLRYKLGDMQFRLKQYEAATETLAKQLEEHPEGELVGPARFLSAECLYRLERVEQALPLFVQVAEAEVEPYHAQSLYRCGACAGQLKRWSESQKHFAALIERFGEFPQVTEARYGLGLALQNQNKLSEARRAYEQVTESTETETAAKARFMIGEIAFAEKDYEQAIEHFLEVTVGYAYEEWQALAQFETARCFVELEQPDKAILVLEKVIDQFPDHPKAKDAEQLIANLNR